MLQLWVTVGSKGGPEWGSLMCDSATAWSTQPDCCVDLVEVRECVWGTVDIMLEYGITEPCPHSMGICQRLGQAEAIAMVASHAVSQWWGLRG